MIEDDFVERRKGQLEKKDIKRAPNGTLLETIEFSVRAGNFFKTHGWRVIEDVDGRSEKEIKKLGANRMCIKDIKTGLAAIGRELKK